MPITAALAGLLAVSAPEGGCRAAVALMPAPMACAQSPRGVALAGTQAEANALLARAEDGAARFRRYFSRPVARYAVAEVTDVAALRALKAAGYVVVLPWVSEAEFERRLDASLRRSLAARAAELHLDASKTAQLIEAGIAAQVGNRAQRSMARAAGEPHELGHGWFTEAFWPGQGNDTGGRYAGPGPDWLDETAAILLESDALAEQRRRTFADIYAGRAAQPMLKAVTRAQLIYLPRLLSENHPATAEQFRVVRDLAGQQDQSGIGLVVLSPEEAARRGLGGAGLFYVQCRVFADYLIERTGRPTVFASLAAAFARGATIEGWLAGQGRTMGLPATVAALDADWQRWVAARYAPSVGAPSAAVPSG